MCRANASGILAISADAALRVGLLLEVDLMAPGVESWNHPPPTFIPSHRAGLFLRPLMVLWATANHEPPVFFVARAAEAWKFVSPFARCATPSFMTARPQNGMSAGTSPHR